MKKVIIPVIAISMIVVILAGCEQMSPPNVQSVLNATTTVPTTVPTTIPATDGTTGSVNSQNKPPVVFTIRDPAKYWLMIKAITDDEALQKFLKEDSSPLMKDREDVVAFLKVLDSVPAFSVENAKHFSISYWPSKQSLHVVYQLSEEKEMHWYRFGFNLDKEMNLEIKEEIKQEAGTKEYAKVGKDRNIEVLKKADLSQTEFAENYAIYRVEVDGMMISVEYKNAYMDVREQKAEDVFSMVRVEETFEKAVTESFRISAEKQ